MPKKIEYCFASQSERFLLKIWEGWVLYRRGKIKMHHVIRMSQKEKLSKGHKNE